VKLHGITSALKVLICAKIMSELMCTLVAVFLNEMCSAHDSGCAYVCLQDVMSFSAVDRYQLPGVISQRSITFMVYDSQRICLDVKLILENSSSVILRKKCLCCFRF